jgi:hypothetical protein
MHIGWDISEPLRLCRVTIGVSQRAVEDLLHEQDIQIIHGCAKHSQSQGLVEQSNLVVKRKLDFWQARTKISSWDKALPFITLVMNKQCHSALPL